MLFINRSRYFVVNKNFMLILCKFRENAWDCGCESTTFKLWLSKGEENLRQLREFSDLNDLQCNSPQYLKNQTLNEMDLSWFPNSTDHMKDCKSPVSPK